MNLYEGTKGNYIVKKGKYKNYEYVIVSYGTHPCCYVEIPKDNILYKQDYDSDDMQDICCHGGLTFSDDRDFEDVEKFYIGWDYAHLNDHMEGCFDGYKWSLKELVSECKSVIEQVINLNSK